MACTFCDWPSCEAQPHHRHCCYDPASPDLPPLLIRSHHSLRCPVNSTLSFAQGDFTSSPSLHPSRCLDAPSSARVAKCRVPCRDQGPSAHAVFHRHLACHIRRGKRGCRNHPPPLWEGNATSRRGGPGPGVPHNWNHWRNQGLLQRLFGVWLHPSLLQCVKVVSWRRIGWVTSLRFGRLLACHGRYVPLTESKGRVLLYSASKNEFAFKRSRHDECCLFVGR